MALDDFRTGDKNNDTGDSSDSNSDDSDNNSPDSTDTELASEASDVEKEAIDNNTDDDNEETSSDDEPSGLDSFRTDASRGGSTTETDSEDEEKTLHDLPPRKWNQMSKEDRVIYVRDNSIPDYHPDYQPDDRWSYERAVEITCVCDNQFTFLTTGICLNCGRTYMDAGRTVVKKHDPHDENEQDNE